MKEDPTYESQYQLNTNTGNTENTYQIPHPMTISGSESRVFFYLETTDLGKIVTLLKLLQRLMRVYFKSMLFLGLIYNLRLAKLQELHTVIVQILYMFMEKKWKPFLYRKHY